MESLKWELKWLKLNRPDSRLIGFFDLAVQKGVTIELDTMWRMVYRGVSYQANDTSELMSILSIGG